MHYIDKLKVSVSKIPKKWLAIAAVFALVAAGAIILFTTTRQPSPQAFSAATTESKGDTSAKPKDWAAEKQQVVEAEHLITEGKLDEAAAILNAIPADYLDYSTVTNLLKTIADKKIEASEKQEPASVAQPKTTTPPARSTPQPAPPAFSTPVTIRGDESCRTDTLNALRMIANSAPGHYSVVTRYVSVIECVPSGSAMYAYESPPRYAVGDATRNAGTLWYASTIVHDANHSRLYHESKEWTGGNAEKICLDAQANSLSKMGAAQSTIDYVNGMKNDPYWQTPVEDRYW